MSSLYEYDEKLMRHIISKKYTHSLIDIICNYVLLKANIDNNSCGGLSL